MFDLLLGCVVLCDMLCFDAVRDIDVHRIISGSMVSHYAVVCCAMLWYVVFWCGLMLCIVVYCGALRGVVSLCGVVCRDLLCNVPLRLYTC